MQIDIFKSHYEYEIGLGIHVFVILKNFLVESINITTVAQKQRWRSNLTVKSLPPPQSPSTQVNVNPILFRGWSTKQLLNGRSIKVNLLDFSEIS